MVKFGVSSEMQGEGFEKRDEGEKLNFSWIVNCTCKDVVFNMEDG
jgi:hypothetical protein